MTITISPVDAMHQQDLTKMMQDISDEFSLPPHHPAYRRREPAYYWVALIGDEVSGSVALLMEDGYAVLKSMFVKKELRGSGIAALLLATAIQQCSALNMPQLYLGTLGVFKAAQRFYEKNGFIQISYSQLPHGFPHNLSDEVFYMLALYK